MIFLFLYLYNLLVCVNSWWCIADVVHNVLAKKNDQNFETSQGIAQGNSDYLRIIHAFIIHFIYISPLVSI